MTAVDPGNCMLTGTGLEEANMGFKIGKRLMPCATETSSFSMAVVSVSVKSLTIDRMLPIAPEMSSESIDMDVICAELMFATLTL